MDTNIDILEYNWLDVGATFVHNNQLSIAQKFSFEKKFVLKSAEMLKSFQHLVVNTFCRHL